jgi:uncharacterized protein YegL
MRRAASDNPFARVLVRAVRFASRAEWLTPEAVPLQNFQWHDIEANGETAMGEALLLVADALDKLQTGARFLPPVLVLVTDGHPTDDKFDEGLRRLMAQPLGRAAVRLAVAIGSDADIGRLQEFIGNPDIHPLQAGNADALAQMITFASKSGISLSSTPGSRIDRSAQLFDYVSAGGASSTSNQDVW